MNISLIALVSWWTIAGVNYFVFGSILMGLVAFLAGCMYIPFLFRN